MSCRPKVVRRGIWSRATKVTYPDLIKFPDPFGDHKPFKPTFDKKITPNMRDLLNMGYLRMWNEQHEAYMLKRGSIFVPTKKHFPIYRKPVKKPEEPKQIAPTKKYAHVKPKINTYLPKTKDDINLPTDKCTAASTNKCADKSTDT